MSDAWALDTAQKPYCLIVEQWIKTWHSFHFLYDEISAKCYTGPAPLLFNVDTVKQTALHQLVPGSPLRTLCLLIAGQPAEVISADSGANGNAQLGANGMLDDWEENLAVIIGKKTKDDELVLIHLGDVL